jgi:putative DNA primase/helicase
MTAEALSQFAGRPVWVAWQVEPDGKNGRPTKTPYNPNIPYVGPRKYLASSTDRATWSTREVAERYAQTLPKPFESGGIGIVLGDIGGGIFLCGIDLDSCRDVETGELTDWATRVIARFASYTEISPSETGVKVYMFVRKADVEALRTKTKIAENGKTWSVPTANKHPPAIELHLGARYYAVTDNLLGEKDTIREVPLSDLIWLATEEGPALSGKQPRELLLTQADIESAFAVIPNENASWDDWNTKGMAIFAASGGGDWGRKIFEDWSRKSAKHSDDAVADRWQHYHTSPPDRLTVGSIVYWARAAEPGWDPASPISAEFSDDALALRFTDKHGENLRYTAIFNHWHRWDGSRWLYDEKLGYFDLARDLCRKEAGRAVRGGKTISSASTVAAVITMTRSDRRIAADSRQWDTDEWLLATPGGTVDLRTGELRPSRRADYITRAARATPGGDCPLWRETLSEITGGNEETVAYLKRLAGYCLSGSVREEKVFFLYGTGGNGKGTFIETLAWVLGDYTTTVAMNTLVMTKHSEHPTEIAMLRGMRLAVTSETKDGARWNVARIKALSGGDQLSARYMRGDYFKFQPSHKLVVSSNSRPALGTVDNAIRRRIELIPFDIEFRAPILDLKARLRTEAGGILAWAVEGCLDWLDSGMATPAHIRAATDEYLETQDDTALFMADTCVRDNSSQVAIPQLYILLQDWVKRTGAWLPSKKEFTQRLMTRGIQIVYGRERVAYARGWRIEEATGASSGDTFETDTF